MAEVEAGEQGHMADDQPQRGVGDVQASEPEIDHVAEFAAIVLTCKGRGEAEQGLSALLRWGIPDPALPPRSAPSMSPSSCFPQLPRTLLSHHRPSLALWQPGQQLTGFVCWRRE